MTVQITVRLPDDDVAFLDQLVLDGRAASRTDALRKVVRRERRRQRAERDVLIMLAAGPTSELDTPEHEAWASENAALAWSQLDHTDWSQLA